MSKVIEAFSITIEGRVQRVGFRRYAENLARRYKLQGYVQNKVDGTVQVFAQGNASSLEAFTNEIGNAPEPIEVDGVVKKKARPIPSLRYFRIKPGQLAEEMQEGFGAIETQFNDYRAEFRESSRRTDQNFSDSHNEFKYYRSEFKGYSKDFKEFTTTTDHNFTTLGNKYGEISAKLTEVLETLERESAETRRELTRVVDKLSNLVDQYIKSQQEKT